MIYGIELKEILDKCDLSESERVAFEDYMDSKVLRNKEVYPDCEETFGKASSKNPILIRAREKIVKAGQWGQIITLWYKMY